MEILKKRDTHIFLISLLVNLFVPEEAHKEYEHTEFTSSYYVIGSFMPENDDNDISAGCDKGHIVGSIRKLTIIANMNGSKSRNG